jgi:hypothetical protein
MCVPASAHAVRRVAPPQSNFNMASAADPSAFSRAGKSQVTARRGLPDWPGRRKPAMPNACYRRIIDAYLNH